MMRPVTRVFSANDRGKSDCTNDKYDLNIASESDVKKLGQDRIDLGIIARDVTEITRGTLA